MQPMTPSASPPRILVVEDEHIVALDIQQQLLGMGYQPVGHATTGDMAIAMTEQLKPDLVLMDIQLGSALDGIAAAQSIRNQLQLPVVFLTAFAADEVIDRAKLTEPFGYILKPFSERDLRTVIEMALFKHRAEMKLRDANAQTQAILDNVLDAVITFNAQGLVQSFNAAAIHMFDYTVSEALGQNMDLLIPPLHNGQHGVHLIRHAGADPAGGMGRISDLVGQRKDGRLFPLTLAMSKISRGGQTTFIGLISDTTERNRIEAALRGTAAELRAVSGRVLEVQEAERRRLAIELHDELGQSLTAIKINLQAHARFKDQSPLQTNEENIRIVDHALQQVRSLALALRPSMLDDLGLAPALRWLAEQTSSRGGFEVTFHAQRLELRLASEIETACYRIAQEALTNISRYAHATHVAIDFYQDGEMLVLNVTDDGRGFDVDAMRHRAKAGKSLGVLGMQERASLLGGQLAIESQPGQGCKITLRCPLRIREEAQP
jgi:PAS domain S-box-containing protein